MSGVTIYPHIEDTIQRQAERHIMVRKGRGMTHLQSFKEGAKLVLDLFRSGKYSITQIK